MKHLCYILLPVFVLFLGCSDKSTGPSINQIVGADSPIDVPAGGFRDVQFTVSAGDEDNAVLRGEFTVVGGERATVLVMTAADFATWRSSGTANSIYSSGQVVNGDVDENITDAGVYHVVFSNTSDTAKAKRVISSIALFTDVGDEF